MNNKIDTVEVETYVNKYFYTVCNTIIFLGLIVIIMSPFIIDHFTKQYMDKYIIDGVEYSYGEEVEVSDDNDWDKRIFVGYIKNSIEPIICVSDGDEENFKNGEVFYTSNWEHIRKIKPTLSGKKAKLILEDGTEYSVTLQANESTSQ